MQSEPQFATVTLLNLTNENEQTTLRVPVGNETTVKQLAKEAMRRWVVLKRFSKEQMPLPVITQVYVGGSDTQPSADVFAHDVVTQVIAVRSEMVFMKLSLQSPQKNKTEPAAASETVAEGTRAVEKAAKEKKPSPPPKKVEKEEAKLPKDFPIDKVNEKSRLKWGPSAHLLFPENYESSPGKRAKRTRTRSEKPKDASGDENTKRKIPAPKVSRQIEFNEVDDASEGERPTVAHEVKLDESPAEPEVKLPKGWGRDALKYFDPETYCDDPRKAKIPPGMTFKSRRSCVN
ncbi:hypothetical protein ADEAN_000541000 [Angomonas deanei]|uniref:Uncharacterized protein n=1 Tax=Angomonas deanei TaxID=59799 RepID=A0A7G2CGC5_9TRYP|nr:hypothetical protein ADEAN_000541000 [Angomonas deanei]